LQRHHRSSIEVRRGHLTSSASSRVPSQRPFHDRSTRRQSQPTSTKRSGTHTSPWSSTKKLLATRSLNTSKQKSEEGHGQGPGHRTNESTRDQECSTMTRGQNHQAQARCSAAAAETGIKPTAELQALRDSRNKPSTSSTRETLLLERTRPMFRSRCMRSHLLMTEKCREGRRCQHGQGNNSHRATWGSMIGTMHLSVHKSVTSSESPDDRAGPEEAHTSKESTLLTTILIQTWPRMNRSACLRSSSTGRMWKRSRSTRMMTHG